MPTGAPIEIPIRGIDEYTREFQSAARQAQKFGRQLTNIGQTLTLGLTVPIVGIATAGVMMSRDLNKAMAQVGTLIPNQRDKLEGFRKDVIKIGKDAATEFGVVAEGLYETISAFGDAEDPINKLTLASKMAKAGMSSVKDSLALVSAVTKGYGDVSDEAAQSVADMSFLTVKLGQTTFPDLAASMGNVIPLASTLQVPMQELFGSMATLTGVTGGAAEVSTQLASALGAVLKPSSDMVKASKKLGFESSVAMFKEIGFMESIKRLNTVAKGNEIELGKLFHRKEGLNAVLTLLGPQAQNFADKTLAMGQAAGATNDAFLEINEGIDKSGATWDQLIIRFKAWGIQIGDKILPLLSRLFDKIDPYLNKIMNLSDYHFELGLKIAGVVAAIGPFLWVVGKTITVVSSLASAIAGVGGLAGVLAAITGPIGIGVAAISGFIAIMVYCKDETEELRSAIAGPFTDVFIDLKDIFSDLTGSSSGFGDGLKKIMSVVSPLLSPVVKLATALLLFPLKAWTSMMKVAVPVVLTLTNGLKVLGHFLKNGFDKLVEFKNELKDVAVLKYFVKALDWIGDKLENIAGWFKYVLSGVKEFSKFLGKTGDDLDIKFEKADRERRGVKTGEEWLQSSQAGYPNLLESSFDEDFLIDKRQSSEADITISFKDLPTGVEPKVEKAKGGKLSVKRKGGIMPSIAY